MQWLAASTIHRLLEYNPQEERYKRDFGLRLLLDTHPNVSSADATLNLTQPYMCEHVPRRNLVCLITL